MAYKVAVSTNGDVPEGAFQKEIERKGFSVEVKSEVPFEAMITRDGMNPAMMKEVILAIRRVAKREQVSFCKFKAEIT